MNTNFTTANLQAASAVLSSNTEAIEALRKNNKGVDLFEAAQMFLIDKYNLSQTEACEVVTDLKAGIEEYQTARTAVEANQANAVREAIKKSLNTLSSEEQTRYLASMLTALQLASNSALDQATIDEAVKANANETNDVLIEKIVKALDTLPLAPVAEAAQTLNAETIKVVADAISQNTADYRLMAAVQLYAAQREELLKLHDTQVPLSPQMLGALASASVDAMLATSALNDEKITLAKWQVVMKYILGALFVVACSYVAVLAITAVAMSVMVAIWSVIGTSIIAIIVSFAMILPILKYGMDYAIEGMMNVVEWLSPIYDKVVQTVTNWVVNVFNAIKSWLKNASHTANEEQCETQPTTATTANNSAMADSGLALA